jgi:hypothetical protein
LSTTVTVTWYVRAALGSVPVRVTLVPLVGLGAQLRKVGFAGPPPAVRTIATEQVYGAVPFAIVNAPELYAVLRGRDVGKPPGGVRLSGGAFTVIVNVRCAVAAGVALSVTTTVKGAVVPVAVGVPLRVRILLAELRLSHPGRPAGAVHV